MASGRLVEVQPTTYAMAGSPDTYYRRLLAAVLAAGPGAVASHRAAVELWHLDGPERDRVEISVPAGRRPRLWRATLHRVVDEPRVHVRHGVATTDPMRALLDLGAVASDSEVRHALNDARRSRLVTDEGMRRLLDNLGRSGRNGVGALRRIYALIDEGEAPPDSIAEARFARHLRALRPRPQFQQDVYDAVGRWLGRTDWLVDPALLTIELNGWGPHSSPEAHERDHRRRARFMAAGYEVYEVTPNRARAEPDVVIAEIQDQTWK